MWHCYKSTAEIKMVWNQRVLSEDSVLPLCYPLVHSLYWLSPMVVQFAIVVWRQNRLLPSNWLTLNCDLNHDQHDHNGLLTGVKTIIQPEELWHCETQVLVTGPRRRISRVLRDTGWPSNQHLCFTLPKFFWLNSKWDPVTRMWRIHCDGE